ncbi:MAG: AAA family ATPase [Candidatus Altiarchaeota archaeon]|nr:AAA family ATPase [Candidatus Altiarchaeota archaeon]
MIITIGGSVGSGKTTLAKELAEKFGMKHISAGVIMREMAKRKKMSLMEFSRYAESDPKIDKMIDGKQKEKASAGNSVVDGRLSAHFLEADLRIWLDASLDVRAERVACREGISESGAREHILEREESERKRYLEIYGIDLCDMSVYDLVIRNDRFSIENTVDIVSGAVNAFN